jgi:Spy/CpxP family protein refolding chaperone
MKMSKWFVIALAAAVTAGGGIVLKAPAADSATPQSARPQRPTRGQLLEKAREALGLSDEQVAQFEAQFGGERETLKALASKLHVARVGVREAIQASNANEASVRAAAAKVAVVEADLAVERFKLYGKLNPILTPDQREKLKEFMGRFDDFLDNAANRLGERL